MRTDNKNIISIEQEKTTSTINEIKQKETLVYDANENLVVENKNQKIFLFGGGDKEIKLLNQLQNQHENVIVLAGKLKFKQELDVISNLDTMLSMDSGNAHIAAMLGVKVITLWGATHPYAGFMGWKQLPVNTVQLDLSCRPCSVYGQKPCWRGDYACLRDIKPEQVIAKIEGIVG